MDEFEQQDFSDQAESSDESFPALDPFADRALNALYNNLFESELDQFVYQLYETACDGLRQLQKKQIELLEESLSGEHVDV